MAILNKKTQIFIFDLILSVIIIVVTLGVIFSYYFETSVSKDIYDINMNILNGFTMTKINSLNDDEIRKLFIAGKVRNIENTVANQIAEFYYYDEKELAKNLTKIYITPYIDTQYNTQVELVNETGGVFVLYSFTSPALGDYEHAQVASTTSRILFGFLNTKESYGPYIFRIKIWY